MVNEEHNKQIALELANRTLAMVIAESGALIIIGITALLGNASVLYVFLKSPRFRTVTNYYLITLAVSDISYSLTIAPVTVIVAVNGRDVVGPKVGTAFGLLGYTLATGSLLTTALIAVNRFTYIVKPQVFRKYFKHKPALIMIISMWIIASLNAGSVFVSGIAKFHFFPGKFCYLLAIKNHIVEVVYTCTAYFLFVILPMFIASLCYWNIQKLVKEHQNSVALSLSVGDGANVTVSDSQRMSRSEIHITKAVLALVCGFVICWIPPTIISNLGLFYDLSRHVQLIFIYTTSLSTAINPIIFNVFNKPFRKQFLGIFCGWCQNRRVADVPKKGHRG